MNKKSGLITFRLLFGILDIFAITFQVIYLAQHNALNLVNFFSYFTILSNVLAAFVLIFSALYLFKKRKPSQSEELVRSAATLYMAVTGIVYATLLSGQNLGLLLPWVNDVLHRIMPIVVVADWLYRPTKATLTLKQFPRVLIFPVTFLTYSLIRGPIVNWYPYPFLNPSKAHGYSGVSLYCLGIVVLFFGLYWLLIYLGSKLKRNVV
jgi:hypothetical protein